METKPKDSDENYNYREKKPDEMFCYSCGVNVKLNAYSCRNCGVGLKYISHKYTTKEKGTALFLSIFTSFFVWLYLFNKSKIKFWVGSIVSIVSIIMSKVAYDSLVDKWYLFLIPFAFVWVFAIIDIALKNQNYYKSFGGN